MSTTFSNALSGLNANSLAIDVVSGNLANLNTTGYKANSVSFQDLINESLGGSGGTTTSSVGGSTVAQATRSFTQGSIQTTSQPFDAAIQGNGFFVLKSANGAQGFTRSGNFKVDATGNLLTQTGQFVQGWNTVAGTLNTNGAVSNIKLPISGLRTPSPTANISLAANLNANAAVGSTDGTFSSPVPVVDAQGNTHVLTVTYTKTSADIWSYNVTIPAADLASGGTGSSTLASGSFTFDGTGHLTSPPATGGPVSIPITGLSNGAADLTVQWGIYDSNGVASLTQFAQASANLGSTGDGSPSGQLTDVSIGTNGQVFAHYTNGDAVAVAQLALASVLNPDSMQDLGDNNFGVTSATSLPAIGIPGTGSRGQISGGALETSTVDIAKEFTNLLTYERGYQANSKVITTEDDILQETVALKR
ncbi:MAG: flagellar hook-basal body complex protein [Acidobacteriota bacterium]